MEVISLVNRFTFNTAATSTETLRATTPINELFGNQPILLYGVQYQLRVLRADRPDIVPWLGATLSKARIEDNFWSGSNDLKIPGLFHADCYDGLPAKDHITFPGGSVEFGASDILHHALTAENLDGNATFNKTVRWQMVLFFEYKEKARREILNAWQEISKL